MITFIVALFFLIGGYFIYGRYVEKVFGPNPNRPTPAITKADGVDFIPLPTWKIFMIQFLNIAGLGPIFGAIMGAKFGTSSYLWIVFGSIFAGATHDYLSGMLSVRNGGDSLPELIGKYLGLTTKQIMRGFTVLLMILVGAVFVAGPADLLAKLTPDHLNLTFWASVVFGYYILATLLPIDKIIGKIYPLFAAALLFMAVGILVMLIWHHPDLPEITSWASLKNTYPGGIPIFPMMFVSIACGAISGFHATQSPLMARCMTNEKYGRPVFYGAMITEGIVALIWAAAATYFFHNNGMEENNAAVIVDSITKEWLGAIGGFLAILGVIAAPITSGDTAFRSARLIVADFLHIDQKPILKRLAISIPLFIIGFFILQMDFSVLWRYFAWCNQTLAVFTLWAVTVYLARAKKNYWITLIPALFMTSVCTTYICVAPEGFSMDANLSYGIGIASTFVAAVWYILWYKNKNLYMKKYKKSSWLTALLFVYVTAMAIYFLPRNTQTGDTEKYLTVAASYVIILLLWFVLRRKERLAFEREKDIEENEKKKTNNNLNNK